MSLREIAKDTTLAELEAALSLNNVRLESLGRSSDGDYSLRLRNTRGLYYGTGKSIFAAFRDALDDVVCSDGAWTPALRKTPRRTRTRAAAAAAEKPRKTTRTKKPGARRAASAAALASP